MISLRGNLLRACFALCLLLSSRGGALAATHFVDIEDDVFLPRLLTVDVGDTVTWTNQTGSAHSVVADDGSFASTAGGASFIPFGQSFSHTFTAAGLNPYFCQLHGGPGGQDMSGVIRVVTPGQNAPPGTPTNVSPVAGAAAQSTAPTLRANAFSDSDEGDLHAASQWILRNTGTNEILDTGEDTVHKTQLPLVDLAGSTVYAWKVRYRDDRGAWSEYSAETQFTTVADQVNSGTGLSASYGKYAPATGAATILTSRVDPAVNFDWKLGKANGPTPANNFFVRWEGQVLPEFSDRYRFRIKADGGVRLWINGQLIIDDWVAGPFALFRNNVADLQAGVPVAIKLEYFDTLGNASVSLRWSSRSRPLEVIPQARLFPLPQ